MDFSFALGKRSRFWNTGEPVCDDDGNLVYGDDYFIKNTLHYVLATVGADFGLRLALHVIETMSINEMLTCNEKFVQDLGKLLIEKGYVQRSGDEETT